MWRAAVVATTLLCFTACTSLQPLEQVGSTQIREEVEVGERVIIEASNGQTYDLEVTKLGDDALWGRAKTGKYYKIPFAAIKSIKAEQLSGSRTAGGTSIVLGAALTVVVVVAILAVLDAFDESLEDFFDFNNDDGD